MAKQLSKIVVQAMGITLAAGAVALATNSLRPDGIPIIADVEYEIFAQCKDSEVTSLEVNGESFNTDAVYVDARPEEVFQREHVAGAINVPYSVLFGADSEDVAFLKAQISAGTQKNIIVYGMLEDSSQPGEAVDVAGSLAEQLVESGMSGVKHIKGGLKEMKKLGMDTVKGDERVTP